MSESKVELVKKCTVGFKRERAYDTICTIKL